MQRHSPEQQEAVFLFQGDFIAREMLYTEFEAILDGFVPVTEYAGGLAKAVYVQVNPGLTISAAVFFILEFDADGMIDRRWNVPLQQLVAAAARGPDLGAGPIRLACFSQCPIEWQRKNLWDPQMQPGCNSFVLMRKAIKENRLQLTFKAPVVTVPEQPPKQDQQVFQKALHERYLQALRDRVAQVIKEQRLRIATLVNLQKSKVESLQQEHQRRLEYYQEQLHAQQKKNSRLEERIEDLKENLLLQEQKAAGIREYFTHKLQAAQNDENEQLKALQESFASELEVRIAMATAELQEMLDMREVELFYRHQQENNLKEEIAHLRQKNQELVNQGGNQLLNKLNKAGINFVAFHPGAGHLTVALDDVARYMENPSAFAAASCGVSEQLYLAWLAHNNQPQCTGTDAHGEVCGKPVVRVAMPSEFHEGESDRCMEHQLITQQRMAEYR